MDLKVTQFEVVMIVSLDEDLTFKMLQCSLRYSNSFKTTRMRLLTYKLCLLFSDSDSPYYSAEVHYR